MSIFSYGDDFEVKEADIPCPGAQRTGVYDPRPPQITLRRTYGVRMSMHSDWEKNELAIHTGGHAVTLGELKFAAAEHRKHGALDRITIFIDPDIYREMYAFFQTKGFDRDMTREDAHSRDFCVTKSYVKTAKLVSDASTVEEKLAEAKRLTKTTPEPVPVVGDFRPRVTT
jgi:hypothetical protein